MNNEFDAFEQRIHDALQGDEMPGADFSRRVMAQVRETSQHKASRSMPRFKVWQIAACIAVVVLAVPAIWLSTMRCGSAGPKTTMEAAEDCAPEEAPAAAEESFSLTAVNGAMDCEPAEGAMEEPKAKAQDNVNQETVVISDPDVAAEVLAWLEENGYVDDGGYLLSAEEAEALMKSVPQAQLPLCTVQLILEGGQ